MKCPKTPTKYNLVQYLGKNAVATLHWNLPYAIIKFKKQVAELNKTLPKGTYFKPEKVEDPTKRKLKEA